MESQKQQTKENKDLSKFKFTLNLHAPEVIYEMLKLYEKYKSISLKIEIDYFVKEKFKSDGMVEYTKKIFGIYYEKYKRSINRKVFDAFKTTKRKINKNGFYICFRSVLFGMQFLIENDYVDQTERKKKVSEKYLEEVCSYIKQYEKSSYQGIGMFPYHLKNEKCGCETCKENLNQSEIFKDCYLFSSEETDSGPLLNFNQEPLYSGQCNFLDPKILLPETPPLKSNSNNDPAFIKKRSFEETIIQIESLGTKFLKLEEYPPDLSKEMVCRCILHVRCESDDFTEDIGWIECVKCKRWFHKDCFFVESISEMEFICELCFHRKKEERIVMNLKNLVGTLRGEYETFRNDNTQRKYKKCKEEFI